MAVIRSDLIGVIHAPLGISTVILRAGDTVPEGAKVHESRLEGAAATSAIAPEVAEVDAPAGNASSAVWAEFLEAQGVDVPEDATRSQMIALWESHN